VYKETPKLYIQRWWWNFRNLITGGL